MGKEKKEENYIKPGKKALKNFPRRKLSRSGKKINLKGGGGGNDRNAQYIPLGGHVNKTFRLVKTWGFKLSLLRIIFMNVGVSKYRSC